MKKFLKTAGIVAVANFLCFWMIYGLLAAAWPHAGLGQFLGFAPAPPPSHWLVFLQWTFGVLSAPGSVMLDGVGSANMMLLIVLCSILNCIIWGVCLGFPVYAIRKRFWAQVV